MKELNPMGITKADFMRGVQYGNTYYHIFVERCNEVGGA